MINFSIKLTNDQIQHSYKIICKMLSDSFPSLTYENYLDYYNIRSIIKKIMLKLVTISKKKGFARIGLTGNEIRSLRILVNDNQDWLKNMTYENSIFRSISDQANRQEVNYITNFEKQID